VLPAVSFTPSGAAPVPAAVLIVPWPAVGAIAAGSLGLLGATILLAHRRLARISVAATLRAGVE
ncbi:MAG: hypothetical protein ACRDGQ_05570, partial [Candidatus Limnocylindrales bacterium]